HQHRAGQTPRGARGARRRCDCRARSRALAEAAREGRRAGHPREHGRPGPQRCPDRHPPDDPTRRASQAGRDPRRRHAGVVLGHEPGRAAPRADAGRAHGGDSVGVWLQWLADRRPESTQRRRIGAALKRVAPALLVVLATAPAAHAGLFRWTAADGAIHYTSDLESVPEAYRAAVVDLGAPLPRAEAPSPTPPGTVLSFTGGAPVVVQARLNGVPLSLLLDTGADRTVIAPAAVARAGIDLATGSPVRISGVTGSTAATMVAVQ